MSATAKKKAKTDADADGFETLRRYILDCPHFSNTPDHPAIRAALAGIDQEEKRMARDAKLQRKFLGEASTVNTVDNTGPCITQNEKQTSAAASLSKTSEDTAADDELMEWQDVAEGSDRFEEEENPSVSFLGKKLSSAVIASIAKFQARANAPIGAVAVALHAALVSDVLGFACTGVFENKPKQDGFAPPIRELPKSQFLPKNWEKTPNARALRYRKNGTGSVVLEVEQDESNVKVHLRPTSSTEPPSQFLSFPIEQHINLDSWNAAAKESPAVPPALHYKGLPMLLTDFAKTFDLGVVVDDKEGASDTQLETLPYMDSTIRPGSVTTSGLQPPVTIRSGRLPTGPPHPMDSHPGIAVDPMRPLWNNDEPPTIYNAFPHAVPTRGDFSGDLLPSAVDPRGGGSLMGPNHPAFVAGGIGKDGMRPRFDPYGPPGGPADLGPPQQHPRRPNRPGGTGNPNPDHERPPQNLGNMFL